jgi:hypothetical protein
MGSYADTCPTAGGWLPGLDSILQCGQVAGHLVPGLPVDDERDEDLADAVASNSTAMLRRDRVSARGSTVTSTVDRMGPSMPRMPMCGAGRCG